ncbi:MAG: hypothetical protein R3D05_11600 [Dongiaceae bacterium]
MDLLTAIVCFAVLLLSAAFILEIALKRPETFLEMSNGTRAFAEAPVQALASKGVANHGRDRGPKSEHRTLAAA